MVNAYCGKTSAHVKHRWYTHWWNKTSFCPGIKPLTVDEAWRMANPSLGHRVTLKTFDERDYHKHHYRVKNKVLITPQGMSVVPSNVYWQCMDPKCWHIYFMSRKALREEMLKKPVYQTWPG